MSRITIFPAPPSVTRCEPNLMPFHIEYNGSAPISTYLHVQDAKKNVGAPEPTQETLEESNHESQRTVVDNEPALESSCSSSTLVPTESADSQLSESTLGNQQSDLPNRYISTFRGRTIHGLAVDVPDGFTGVMFRSEGANTEQQQKLAAMKEKEKLKAAAAKRRAKGKKGNGKVIDVDTPGRRTRSSARKGVEDEDMDVDEDEEDEEDAALQGEEEERSGGTKINLVPASSFSSFRLWHPDIPVDTGKDEYFGALSEWMKIAQVVRLF
ncbi:hypothetical protein L218DRAFT_868601 [Marasmius fiardii PR-910]|nr:hypothetical protein L218DRAFT_868601 [Marasmius fiardii PR-910]